MARSDARPRARNLRRTATRLFRRGWEAVEYLVVEDDAEEVVLEFSSGEPDPAWRRLLREQLVGNSGTLQDADAKNHGLEDPEM